jgi:hypothetical protein
MMGYLVLKLDLRTCMPPRAMPAKTMKKRKYFRYSFQPSKSFPS